MVEYLAIYRGFTDNYYEAPKDCENEDCAATSLVRVKFCTNKKPENSFKVVEKLKIKGKFINLTRRNF